MSRHLSPVQGDQIEIGAETADRDRCAFTSLTINCHAGNALKRFCKVGVGEITNIFGGDGVDNTLRIPFGIHGPLQAGTDTSDDDLFDQGLLSDRVLSADGVVQRDADGDGYGLCETFFGKRLRMHDVECAPYTVVKVIAYKDPTRAREWPCC